MERGHMWVHPGQLDAPDAPPQAYPVLAQHCRWHPLCALPSHLQVRYNVILFDASNNLALLGIDSMSQWAPDYH